jgi:hypothetical protein
LELAPSSPDEAFLVALPPLPPLLLLLIHRDNDDIMKFFVDFFAGLIDYNQTSKPLPLIRVNESFPDQFARVEAPS